VISIGAIVGIAAVSVVMVLTPGPNMIYLVSRSITQGRRAGLISLTGIAVGFLIYLVAAIAGIATLFALVPTAYIVIKLAGAAYLFWLAWKTVRPGGQPIFAPKALPVDLPRKLFTMGLVTSLLNPKIAIMYISLLPQFVDPDRGSVAAQSLTLGLIQISISLTIDAVYVLAAGSMAAFFSGRPRWLNAQRYVMGTALAGFAVHIGLA